MFVVGEKSIIMSFSTGRNFCAACVTHICNGVHISFLNKRVELFNVGLIDNSVHHGSLHVYNGKWKEVTGNKSTKDVITMKESSPPDQ